MTGITPAPRRRRLLLWGLAASLAVNGFLVGLVATDYFSGDRRRGGTLYFETRSIGRNLPEAEREEMISAVRALLPDLRPRWRELRELRREINRIVAEPQPDRAAIEERLERIRRITAEVQMTVQGAVFDTVLEFSPEVRAEIPQEEEERPD